MRGSRRRRKLTELQADLERLMRRLGLPAEGRKFVPHVTLARLRDTSPLDVAHYPQPAPDRPAYQLHGAAAGA